MFYIYFLLFFNSLSWLLCYIVTPREHFVIKSVSFTLLFFTLISFFNIFFDIYLNSITFILELILFVLSISLKSLSFIKSSNLDKKNVFLIFYISKTTDQNITTLFTPPFCSSGLVIYDDKIKNHAIYQMRWEHGTLQKRPFNKDTKKYLHKNYIIVKTDLTIKELNEKYPNWEKELLLEKAEDKDTFSFRKRCLKSLRKVLSFTKKFKYSGEIYPSLYITKLIITGAI